MADAAAKPVKRTLGYKKPVAKAANATVVAAKPPPEIVARFAEEPPKASMEVLPLPAGGAGAAAAAKPVVATAAPKPAAAAPKPKALPKPAPKPVAHASEKESRADRVLTYLSDRPDSEDGMRIAHQSVKSAFQKRLATEAGAPLKAFEEAQKHEEEDSKYLTDIVSYMPSTRKDFYEFINDNFTIFNLSADPRSRELDPEACEKLLKGGPARVEPFLYQKFVKEYTRMASPYRGLLVYHGLGSGKTCSSIAAMEALYGVSNRRVIVMTPFSLRGNFINEIKFCGFRHLSTNNHWTKLPLMNRNPDDPKKDGTTNLLHEIFARSVLSLSATYLEDLKKRQFVKGDFSKTPVIWMPDFEKAPNYDSLKKEEQQLIQAQINETINNRIEFINYNGVTSKTLKRWACEEQGHFDNAVIVIDEVHNMIRLMQGTIEPYLFERSKRVRKIKAEPVTPGRWRPGLCGKIDNYKRGYLFYRLLTDARNSKIVALSGTPLINFPEEIGILSNILAGYIECIEFSVNTSDTAKLQAMKALIEKEPRVDIVRWKVGAASAKVLVSLFNEGYVKVLDESTGQFEGVKYTKEPVGQESITIVAGRIVQALQTSGLTPSTPTYVSYPRLPPDQTTFRQSFVDLVTSGVNEVNKDVLRKRLTGLVSYYKGSKADFVPEVTKDEDVFCDLSPYAFQRYSIERKGEIEGEREKEKTDKAEALYAAVEMYAKAKNPSSYRFRSRAICNFAFPEAIPRPYPSDVDKALEQETKPIEEDLEIAEAMTNPEEDARAAAEVAEEEAALDRMLEEEEEKPAAVAAVTTKSAAAKSAAAAVKPPGVAATLAAAAKTVRSTAAALLGAPTTAAEEAAQVQAAIKASADPYKQQQMKALAEQIKIPGAGAGAGVSAKQDLIQRFKALGGIPSEYGIDEALYRGGGSSEEEGSGSEVSSFGSEEMAAAKKAVGSDEESGSSSGSSGSGSSSSSSESSSTTTESSSEPTPSSSNGSEGAVVEAAAGYQATRPKTYEELVADAMARLDANRAKYLQLDPPAGSANSLSVYSTKLDKILRKLAESPGPNLVYSQFKTVEGLGVLGIALKANGYEEIKITGPDENLQLAPESIASIRKGPDAGIKRFITFSGDGSKDNKAATLLLFNSRLNELPRAIQTVFQESGWDVTKKYLLGEVCKVIGITGAGAEGISLRNVRQVHIMEPYWNKVRLEQVKGRAVRICSHMDLPMDQRKVEIYTYIAKFSDAQLSSVGTDRIDPLIAMTDSETITDPVTGRKKENVYTSDQMVYNVSMRKERINKSLLSVLKEVAVDCVINGPDNEPDIQCFQTAPAGPGEETKMFDPELQQDITETATSRRRIPVEIAPAAITAAAELASTAVAPEARRVGEVYVEKIEIEDRKAGKTWAYLVGPADPDGKSLLYADNDLRMARPLGEVTRNPLRKSGYDRPVFYSEEGKL
jgi:hypothetical protein